MPLELALRQDMEQRFGHDFSRVRVHSDAAAEQSAREINAYAYTAGHNIVFGAGRFASGTHEGRRLIAHELTHVVQQSSENRVRVGQSNENRGQSLVSQQEAFPPLAAVVQRQTDPMQQHVDDMDMEMERKYANSGAPKAHTCGRPSWCPAGFCSPYTSEKLAEYYRAKQA